MLDKLKDLFYSRFKSASEEETEAEHYGTLTVKLPKSGKITDKDVDVKLENSNPSQTELQFMLDVLQYIKSSQRK